MLNLINRVYDIHYTGMYMYKNQQGKTLGISANIILFQT